MLKEEVLSLLLNAREPVSGEGICKTFGVTRAAVWKTIDQLRQEGYGIDAAGIAFMVPSLAKAAVAVGADGLMIEVHNDPARAKSDGAQSLTPDQFDDLMATIRPELEFFGKTLN